MAADKDGGSHVDAKLPDAYCRLGNNPIGLVSPRPEKSVVQRHLQALRTFAEEVLQSPALRLP